MNEAVVDMLGDVGQWSAQASREKSVNGLMKCKYFINFLFD